MPAPLLQSGWIHMNLNCGFSAVNIAAEFFVPLDRACDALEAVSQTASKWPGWLHADNANGSRYEHHPLVYHCEVRVGETLFSKLSK
jgi:hypothetical protein